MAALSLVFFVTVLSLLTSTLFASRNLKEVLLKKYAEDLETLALLIVNQFSPHLNPPDQEEIDQLCKAVGRSVSTRITIIMPTGEVLGDSLEDPLNMDNHIERPEVMQALAGKTGVSKRYSRTLAPNMMYVAIPVKEDGRIIAAVRTSIPITSIERAIQSVDVKIAADRDSQRVSGKDF